MIQTTHACTRCDSENLKKNGTTAKGKQKFYCHDCGKYGTLNPQVGYSDERKAEILCAYQERSSLLGIERSFGVSRQTVSTWLKKVQNLPNLKETLLPAQSDNVLELDELCSFVRVKANKQWLWVALCRRTRQVIAFVLGSRGKESCLQLWKRIPRNYKQCQSYSDFWAAYEQVFDESLHQSVGKETGQTAHIERWNNTLRQRISHYVRKTLSFSKKQVWHHMINKLFIYNYNLDVAVNN